MRKVKTWQQWVEMLKDMKEMVNWLVLVKIEDETKTLCIILLVDFILNVSVIVFLPEAMYKAEEGQTWYLVHKEHVVEILELKIHWEEFSKNR